MRHVCIGRCHQTSTHTTVILTPELLCSARSGLKSWHYQTFCPTFNTDLYLQARYLPLNVQAKIKEKENISPTFTGTLATAIAWFWCGKLTTRSRTFECHSQVASELLVSE